MNSSNDFQTRASPPFEKIVLTVRQVVCSFKNRKRIAGLRRLPNGDWRGAPTLITRPDVKRRMIEIERELESELRSTFQTAESGTTTECSQRSLTVSLPQSDDWREIEIGSVKTVLCKPGEERAVITIEKL